MNAVVGFDGPAHRALAYGSLSPKAQAYGQQHVATLSGMYGFLLPVCPQSAPGPVLAARELPR